MTARSDLAEAVVLVGQTRPAYGVAIADFVHAGRQVLAGGNEYIPTMLGAALHLERAGVPKSLVVTVNAAIAPYQRAHKTALDAYAALETA